MASRFITSWQIDGETVETVSDFIFGGSKITADGDCSHEIKRRLLLGRKVMTNLDSILKSRDITLPTKVRLVKAMVFPVVMYEWVWEFSHNKGWAPKSWCFELWCWRRLLRVRWTSRSMQSILNEIKRCLLLGRKAIDKPRQNIKKQRHHFADKGLSSQSYGFSSGHACLWELDHKVS